MDLDLTEYDQVDEAKFFINQRNQPNIGGDLLTTISSEQAKSDELLNCENDFVFLPEPAATPSAYKTIGDASIPTKNKVMGSDGQSESSSRQQDGPSTLVGHDSKQQKTAIIIPDKLDIRSYQPIAFGRFATEISATKKQEIGLSATPQQRVANPLMAINTNGGNNPFHTVQQTNSANSNISLASQSSLNQPFWIRQETFANKPIGLLEVNTSPSSSQNVNHLSDLMHQIVTKSDSIYIALPCSLCHEPKACPPCDISAWLNHMNTAHNCKVCPICNRLVGLGPMRDIEIMRKHVVAHIDNDWLGSKSPKMNFSFGLQNHWFAGNDCSVKDPRSYGRYK